MRVRAMGLSLFAPELHPSLPSSQVVEMVPVLAMLTRVRAQSAEEGRRESTRDVSVSAAASATAEVRIVPRVGATATRAAVDGAATTTAAAAAAVLLLTEGREADAVAVKVAAAAAQHMAVMLTRWWWCRGDEDVARDAAR